MEPLDKEQRFNQLRPLLEGVANRLIPKDEWPSATDAGVLTYIKRQIEEDCDRWVTLIEPGLEALEEEAVARYGAPFLTLTATQQDTLLQMIETGQVENWSLAARGFFSSLMNLVAEGYYGSPEAGGNREGKAWEMIGFHPGIITDSSIPVKEFNYSQQEFETLQDRYDAIVIGAGAGGSVAAAVLSEAGMRVLVVERGRWLPFDEVGRDHVRNHRLSLYGHNTGPDLNGHPRTLLLSNGEERQTLPFEGDYHNNAMTLGGGTRVYGAQAWRFHPDDFRMASRYGIPEGSSLSDWPITYADLEPYYDRAEWEIGVSGDGTSHPNRGRRRREYPMPALSPTLEAEFLTKGAEKLGWDVGPVPLLINSVERDGRPACGRCGECVGFACPTNSKNGGHNTMLVRALATGNCELICETIVERVETEGGKHAIGVRLVQEVNGSIRRRYVKAGQIVVAAGAIESARLLLNSSTDEEPEGIGNQNGLVGRNLQGHVYSGAYGLFDDIIQDGLGPGVSLATCRFSHDNEGGIIGGGMIANEFTRLPLIHWYRTLGPDSPRWGHAGKETMRETYLRTSHVQGPIQEIPTAEARVRLSPKLKDWFGLPVAQLSGNAHPESLRASKMLSEKAESWLFASGASQVWRTEPGGGLSAGQHQAGTLRMGNDPATSVTDPIGRIHGYDNLWVCDGSVHVTNGGVNPVLTIMALAFRTAESIVKA